MTRTAVGVDAVQEPARGCMIYETDLDQVESCGRVFWKGRNLLLHSNSFGLHLRRSSNKLD